MATIKGQIKRRRCAFVADRTKKNLMLLCVRLLTPRKNSFSAWQNHRWLLQQFCDRLPELKFLFAHTKHS